MRRTLKYRLFRSKHDRHLTRRIEYASEIWNHFVALCRRYYRLYGKYPGYYRLKRHLTKLKRQRRYQHWNEVGSQAAQMVIKRLDLAYQAFFDYKAGKRPKVGLPRFKKRSKYSSFTLTQAGWKYEGGNQIRIGIEDLSLKGMQKLWGRKVSDLAFGEFAQILRHVCHRRGVVLEQVERYYHPFQGVFYAH